MSGSLLGLLAQTEGALSPRLLDAVGYARLAEIAGALPAALSTFWGLECRLGHPEPRADILFEIKRRSLGQRLLAGEAPSTLDVLCQDWPIWERLRALSRAWSAPDHASHAAIRNLWLEFDTARAPDAASASPPIASPSVFLGPCPDRGAPAPERLLELLNGLGPAAGLSPERLRDFMARLPAAARPFQFGVMLSRSETGLRVCVNRLSAGEVPDWLARLGWPGEPSALSGLLDRLAPRVRSLAICLSLAEEGIAETVGVECYRNPEPLTREAALWDDLLDLLEDMGLCLPEKRQALAGFPGVSVSPLRDRLGPEGIVYTNLFRTLHHLKLSFGCNSAREAKAYLALNRPGIGLFSAVPERDPWLIE